VVVILVADPEDPYDPETRLIQIKTLSTAGAQTSGCPKPTKSTSGTSNFKSAQKFIMFTGS